MKPRHLAALALALAPLISCTSGSADNAPDAAAVAGYGLFATKDLDQDGALTPAELQAGLAPTSAEESQRLFALLDRDGDGKLAVAEYFPDPGSVHAFGFTQYRADVAP